MSSTQRYMNQLQNYESAKATAQSVADAKNRKELAEDDALGGIGAPISKDVLEKSLKSDSLKSAAKRLLKTGNKDVDESVSRLVDGENPFDVGDRFLSRQVQKGIDRLGSRLSPSPEADTLNENLGDIEMQDVNSWTQPQQTTNIDDLPISNSIRSAFKNRFPNHDTSDENIREAFRQAEDPEFHEMDFGPNKTPQEIDDMHHFIKSQHQQAQSDAESGPEDVEAADAGDIAGDVGATTAGEVGADVGEATALGATEAAGAALDSTGILAPIGALVGLGGLIGSLFGLTHHHHSKPDLPQAPIPTLEIR